MTGIKQLCTIEYNFYYITTNAAHLEMINDDDEQKLFMLLTYLMKYAERLIGNCHYKGTKSGASCEVNKQVLTHPKLFTHESITMFVFNQA